jgi:hypothetical protein
MRHDSRSQGTDREARRAPISGPVLVIALLAMGILGGGFALATATCACTSPPDLVIVNRSRDVAVVDWQAGGVWGTPLFRSDGSFEAPGCGVTSWTLAAGDVTARVHVGSTTRTVALAVQQAGGRHPSFVLIDATGGVGDPTPDWPAGTDDTTTCP